MVQRTKRHGQLESVPTEKSKEEKAQTPKGSQEEFDLKHIGKLAEIELVDEPCENEKKDAKQQTANQTGNHVQDNNFQLQMHHLLTPDAL